MTTFNSQELVYEGGMEAIDLSKIAERRKKLEEEIAQLEKRIEQSRTELVDLNTADRVISRIMGHASKSASKKDQAAKRQTLSKREIFNKPSNLPTLQEMILQVLRKAKLAGQAALEPKQISNLIAENFSPAIKRDSINAIVWTMWKRAVLQKSGSTYALIESQPA